MRKYLKLLPLMLYPYAYLVGLIIYIVLYSGGKYDSESIQGIGAFILGLLFIYNIITLLISIYHSVQSARGKYTALQAARMNLIVKTVQIPAYIFHFILAMIGTMLSIWGIGLILFALAMDLLTIFLTGINSIGCSIKMKKDGILSTTAAVFAGIGCFIFCIDIVIAIIYMVLAKGKEIKNAKILRSQEAAVL